MGRLVIAHHKSYHPYRRDNVERVRRDEEKAAQEEAREDGRVMLADSEARIGLLRERAGSQRDKKRDEEKAEMERAVTNSVTPDTSGLPLTGGHINFFGDLEESRTPTAIPAIAKAKKASAPEQETDKGVRLAPAEKDLKPWYTARGAEREKVVEMDSGRRNRDLIRKSTHDPLTFINSRLSSQSSSSLAPSVRSSYERHRAPTLSPSTGTQLTSNAQETSELASRLSRESSERDRARALILQRKRELAGSETPSTIHGGYGDMYNREEVEEARRGRERGNRREPGRRHDRSLDSGRLGRRNPSWGGGEGEGSLRRRAW